MKISLTIFVISSVLILSYLGESHGSKTPPDHNDIYVVYMGDAAPRANKNNYNVLMNSMMRRKNTVVGHNYKKGFLGFSARLTSLEAAQLAKHPGVVSVFREPIYQLHTTRSWDFLKEETSLLIDSLPAGSSSASSSPGSDTIIGIIDTGIWPESESFSDQGLGPIPSRWKGTCVEGMDFHSSNCNKKLIGARYYKDDESDSAVIGTARDSVGHGTHVASTAAGAYVLNASYYGLASGVAKGGSSNSRIAMYRVCDSTGCSGSAILAAFDDAIADGVDILSLSLGAPGAGPDFTDDPIAIGAFHAVQRGITVVCSAGNEGLRQSVINVAPWLITVAATTIDRDLQSNVVLGNKKEIEGAGINFSELEQSPTHPLIYGLSAKSSSASDHDASNCYPDSLVSSMINGTIVLCQHDDNRDYSIKEKRDTLKEIGGVGVVFISDKMRLDATNTGIYPVTVITSKDGAAIIDYLNSTRNPLATILPTKTVVKYKPAPVVGYFSSRGPSYTTKNVLKPDIAAPGVNVLAAWKGNDTSPATTPPRREPPLFNVISGTSMACPHVSGIVATIKSQNPTWSPAAIRSAIMTTAIPTNNVAEPITTETGEAATPYDIGAGEVSSAGLQPGLIYELDPAEYLQFLCNYGYDIAKIKLISAQLPDGFSCPKNSSKDMISNMNYPSIAVAKIVTTTAVTVTRTVTNVDTDKETTYVVTIDAPKELEVNVMPNQLKFSKDTNKLSYQVTFSSGSSVKDDMFGSITWSNKKYTVRSPFVISSE